MASHGAAILAGLPPAANKLSPSAAASSSAAHPVPPSLSPSPPARNQPKQIDEAKRIKMADKSHLTGVVIGMLIMLSAILAGLLTSKVPLHLILGPLGVPMLMVVWYYLPISTKHKRPRATRAQGGADTSGLPAAYYCYVLGSGGHTTEMMELVRKSYKSGSNQHRRYIFTTGDRNSLVALTEFERRAAEVNGEDAGTWDVYQVTRARNVHQPLYTTWLTAILSALSVYEALTTPPDRAIRPDARDQKLFRYPHVITTNGPGTGFLVAIVAHLLKIFWVRNCMKVIFIETWAHVRTLSLTGKLFHWTKLPDVYLVQHQPLSARYGYMLYEFITLPVPRRHQPPRPRPMMHQDFMLPNAESKVEEGGSALSPVSSSLSDVDSSSPSVSAARHFDKPVPIADGGRGSSRD